MKAKMIVMLIFFMMLLLGTTIPAISVKICDNTGQNSDEDLVNVNFNTHEPQFLPPWWLIGADQKQIIDSNYAYSVVPHIGWAQEFKPTKDKLTAVAVKFYKAGNPPPGCNITVYIRETIKGSNLTEKTVSAEIIKKEPWETWVLFDFDDINVVPEMTYFIVIAGGGGSGDDSYFILFNNDNESYDRGHPWTSTDSGKSWRQMDDLDFCFITFWQKPRNRAINTPFLNWLQNHLNMFPIFSLLLQRFGLQ